MILPISFRVTSRALGQSYDCPSASEVTLKDMGKHIMWMHKSWYDNICDMAFVGPVHSDEPNITHWYINSSRPSDAYMRQ